MLVALSHAGIRRLAGGYIGVDVFFVISGFLITGWLLRRSSDRGVPVRDFYAARARRLLPAAALTLVVTAIASWYLLNFVRAEAVFHDSLWATFFAANVHFAHIGTNYFASATPPSPLQHYWSLAVEEQFYLVWPALLAGAMYLFRRKEQQDHFEFLLRYHGLDSASWNVDDLKLLGEVDSPDGRSGIDDVTRRRLRFALFAFVAVSLYWSVRQTSSNPTAAYFSAFTRAWELGIGGLVALGAAGLARLGGSLRATMSWVGLAGIFVSALTFDTTTAFPGYAAMLPVLSAAFVIIGGMAAAPASGASAVLGRQPLRYIGDVSYSFYLWHWPVLIIAEQYEGHSLTISQNLMLLAGAFALSVATYTFFENPLHRGRALSRPWVGLTMWPVTITAVVVVAAVGLTSIHNEHPHQKQTPVALGSGLSDVPVTPVKGTGKTPGTQAQGSGQTAPADPYAAVVLASVTSARLATKVPNDLSPSLDNLSVDRYFPPKGCSANFGSGTTSDICHLGAGRGTRKLVIFGDSHTEMWITPLMSFAKANGWDLIPMYKEGCVAATLGGGNKSQSGPCTAWYQWSLQQMQQLRPEAVLLGLSYSDAVNFAGAPAQATTGITQQVNDLVKLTPKLVVLGDIPTLGRDPVDCLLAGGATLGSCTYPMNETLASMNTNITRITKAAGAKFLPTLQWFCAAGQCPTVVGNTVAYRDVAHVSPFYANQLTAPLAAALTRALT